MKTVHEVSALSGVSVRTLHYYDEIGLLVPSAVTPSGYRLYEDAALGRLQTILFFRELEFPLKEIRAILSSPGCDRQTILREQIRLLEAKKEHINALIALARAHCKGDRMMDFSAFDCEKQKEYEAEARRRWGAHEAFRAYDKNMEGKTDMDQSDMTAALMEQFAAMGKIRGTAPDSPEAQASVEALQRFITEHFYPCTKQILRSLGEMYGADERFRETIDAAGGKGCAEFAARAIAAYCETR